MSRIFAIYVLRSHFFTVRPCSGYTDGQMMAYCAYAMYGMHMYKETNVIQKNLFVARK